MNGIVTPIPCIAFGTRRNPFSSYLLDKWCSTREGSTNLNHWEIYYQPFLGAHQVTISIPKIPNARYAESHGSHVHKCYSLSAGTAEIHIENAQDGKIMKINFFLIMPCLGATATVQTRVLKAWRTLHQQLYAAPDANVLEVEVLPLGIVKQ